MPNLIVKGAIGFGVAWFGSIVLDHAIQGFASYVPIVLMLSLAASVRWAQGEPSSDRTPTVNGLITVIVPALVISGMAFLWSSEFFRLRMGSVVMVTLLAGALVLGYGAAVGWAMGARKRKSPTA